MKLKKQQVNENSSNTLSNTNYSCYEVCFNIKLKRRGIMKWLEDKNFIKEKVEGFALGIKDLKETYILSSNEKAIFSIISTKVNKLD